MLGVTSYKLALFVKEYLHKNCPEMVAQEIDTPEKLENSILAGGITQSMVLWINKVVSGLEQLASSLTS